MERYLLDEDSLSDVLSGAEDPEDSIARLCDYVADLHERGERLAKYSMLYEINVGKGLTLMDLLFDVGLSPLPKDLRFRLQVAVGKTVDWDTGSVAIEKNTLDFGEGQSDGATMNHGFAKVRAGTLMSCVECPGLVRPDGWTLVTRLLDDASVEMHFGKSIECVSAFYRRVIDVEALSPEQFLQVAPKAFPNLYFAPPLVKQFGSFSRKYDSIRGDLVRHLGGLNDHFMAIFMEANGQVGEVTSRMAAQADLDVSPESSKTHKNADAMKARSIECAGHKICCEWHSKISPEIDRIHFAPGQPDCFGGRVVIGIFTKHLET